MTDSATPTVSGLQGNRVVLVIYAAIVGIAGVLGFVLGAAGPEGLDPELFGVIQLPPSALGTALYGMITVAFVLGILLGLVAYVAGRYDEDSR